MSASATSVVVETGTDVQLRDLRREYGGVAALDGLSLTMRPGELIALLGPSGCGKTTALRILAGLDDPTSGEVIVAGRNVTHLPASKRDMGMVFQAYSLFPHMTAIQNVAFGPRLRGLSKASRLPIAGEMLELVGLSAQADRYPRQMSGGQQQRVALARALAVQPKVLLLDEPLSALDATVRAQLRDEIRRIQMEVGTTTLFVTHDQEEALGVADRVGVMQAGRLEQLASPDDIYRNPANEFVAQFVGLTNRLAARVGGSQAEVLGVTIPVLAASGNVVGDCTALIRPELISVTRLDGLQGADRRQVGTVTNATFLGALTRVTVELGSGQTVISTVPSARPAPCSVGDQVAVTPIPHPALIVR
jgi:putative spermidine/putrescine transport system ATP-binding protein